MQTPKNKTKKANISCLTIFCFVAAVAIIVFVIIFGCLNQSPCFFSFSFFQIISLSFSVLTGFLLVIIFHDVTTKRNRRKDELSSQVLIITKLDDEIKEIKSLLPIISKTKYFRLKTTLGKTTFSNYFHCLNENCLSPAIIKLIKETQQEYKAYHHILDGFFNGKSDTLSSENKIELEKSLTKIQVNLIRMSVEFAKG